MVHGTVYSTEHAARSQPEVEGAPDGSKVGGILEYPLWPQQDWVRRNGKFQAVEVIGGSYEGQSREER